MQEMAAKSQNGGLISGDFPQPVQSSTSKKRFSPPQPPMSEDDEEIEEINQQIEYKTQTANKTANNLQNGGLSTLSDLGSPDLMGIMESIMSNSNDSSKSAKWKLDQLQTLESQLSKLKTSVSAAKVLATQELEDDKKSSPILDLEKNIAFVEVKHRVENIKIVQDTQHDRLKDIVGILNNHADRLCNIEDSIHELKVDFKEDLNDRKTAKMAESKVSLNSMSERLLEKLLKTHESRPHFVLELFELATELDTDQKRAQVIQSVKNVMVSEKMDQIRKLEQKLENAKNGEIPAIENSKRLDFGNISALSQTSSNRPESNRPETPDSNQNAGARTPVQRINDIMQEMANNELETSQTEQTAESDVIPSDTCEQQVLSQEDGLENDMVSQLLRAGNAKIDISSLNEDVNNMVTDLLPILAGQYKDKILTDDIIDEAKITICEHIVRECVKMEKNCAERNADNSAEKNKYKNETENGENGQPGDSKTVEDYNIFAGNNKVYLLTSLEKCLQSYKGENITQESVNILSDIGTNIYRSILNAKINKGNK